MRHRVVVIHRHFWPDTPPYASMLRAIAERWSAEGADVTVLTAQPSYTSAAGIRRRPRMERLGDLYVRRVRVIDEAKFRAGKMINLIGFPIQIAGMLIGTRHADLVMCSTAPQVLLGTAASVVAKARGAKFVYHCMDVHPEIGRLSGEFSNPLVYRALMKLDTATMRRADAVVVLSEDMRQAALDRDPALEDRVVVLNNFALPDFDDVDAEPPLPPPSEGTLRICFTGNVGRFQRLSEVVDALADIDRDVELVFMGDGRAKPELERRAEQLDQHSRLHVTFLPHGSPVRARALMAQSHLGLVSLQPDVVRYAYPSKTATYLCEDLPVLALCDESSELARTVTDERIGWAASDVRQLKTAVVEASTQLARHGDLAEFATRARRYAASNFSEAAALTKWQQLALNLLDDRNPSGV